MVSFSIYKFATIALGFYSLFLATFLFFKDLGEFSLFFAFLVGLFTAYPIRRRGYVYSRDDLIFVSGFVLFLLVSIFALLTNSITDATLSRNEVLLTFLLVLPFYYLIRVSGFNGGAILWVIGLAGILVGVMAVFQLMYWSETGEFILTGGDRFAEFSGRPSGGVNPMRFGAITLCISLLCINGVLFFTKGSRVMLLWLSAGAAFALLACILTQVRGAWLAIPVLALCYFIYAAKRWSRKQLVIVGIVGLVLLGGLMSTPQFQVRFGQAVSNIQSYREGNANTSLGARFDMAKAAWILIKEKPLLGYGLGSYKNLATEIRLENPGMSREVGMWKNPHNEILLVMVERGIPGLVSLLYLFGALGYVYWKYAWREDTAFYAVSGLGILIVYAVVGQSVALFEHEPFTYFFASTHALLMGRMLLIVHGVKMKDEVAVT